MMRKLLLLSLMILLIWPGNAQASETVVRIQTEDGAYLTDVCTEVSEGDAYISADNHHYEIVRVQGSTAIARSVGQIELPDVSWLDGDSAVPVAAMTRRIALYCTHSDECYEPSDGTYSTTQRGTIYKIAHALADALADDGVDAAVSDALHHPHDAGAYRRSRQTAVQLITQALPDSLIDVHRDGIPDPAAYAVEIGGKEASKIRLLVGRGNQNAQLNKNYALTIKAVADRVYPGLIKDIYMGKGAFNQDLLPKAILLECGTYTLEKERVLTSMPMMADVLTRALYGGVVGSAGRVTADSTVRSNPTADITQGEPDTSAVQEPTGVGTGFIFLIGLLVVGVVGIALLSTGSFKGGMRKVGRNISEMTGGLIGTKPRNGEEHDHS